MRQYRRDRIAAFGAIRRAAEIARQWDAIAAYPFDLPLPSSFYKSNADEIRYAIRAAIGSEKT